MWTYQFVENEDKSLTLSEVYYNSKREPYGYCAATLMVDNIDDAETVLDMMKTAIYKPVVKLGQLVEDME